MFARSSPRLEACVLELSTIGPAVRDLRDGVGMHKRAKAIAATMIVTSNRLSAWIVDGWILPLVIVAAGFVGLMTVLFRVPTRPPVHQTR